MNSKGIEHRLDNLDARVQQGFAQMAEGFTRMAQGFEALAAEIGKWKNAEKNRAARITREELEEEGQQVLGIITPVSGELTEEQFRNITGE